MKILKELKTYLKNIKEEIEKDGMIATIDEAIARLDETMKKDIENAMKFAENNPIELTESEMTNFIEKNQDIVEQIAEEEGVFDMVLDDDMPDTIGYFVANHDVKELYEKVMDKLESK